MIERNHKTRGNYAVGVCFKPCKHKHTDKCEKLCISFSCFEPLEDNEDNT